MESHNNFYQPSGDFKSKKFIIFLFIFGIFAIGFFAIGGNFNITGFVSKQTFSKSNSSIPFSGDLNSHNFELDSNFEKIIIEIGSDKVIDIESLQLELKEGSEIILENYDGDFYFGEKEISKLKGKSGTVIVDGRPIYSKFGSQVKIDLGDLEYNLIDIKDDVYVNEIDYVATGNINLDYGKNVFNLYEDKIILKDFFGKITSEEGKLDLDGSIESLVIKGEHKISISK